MERTYAFLDDLYGRAYAFLDGSIGSKYTSEEKDAVIEFIRDVSKMESSEVDDSVVFIFDRAVTILCCYGDKIGEIEFQAECLKDLYEEIVNEFF